MRAKILMASLLILTVLVSSGCVINDTNVNDIDYFKTLCHTFTSFNYDSEKHIIWSTEPIEDKLNSQVTWTLDMDWNMYSEHYYVNCREGSKEGENINYYYCPSLGQLMATQTVTDSEGNILLIDKKEVVIVIIPEEITGETWKTTTKCL